MTHSKKRQWIPNKKERILVYIAFAIAIGIVAWKLWQLYPYPSLTFHTKAFKFMFKDEGSLARLALFVVLAHYAILFVLQKGLINRWNDVKKWMIVASRLARKCHTPFALVALAFIFIHVVGAFLYGIELNFSNVSGLLALLVLLPVPISGILRYRKLDKKWHLRTGLAFAFLFLLHAFL
ncbi:hypothetical protein [Brevibacillus brevis]|uniref:hypothetical protein n=1 Tax=Brevibacillus brevis TaxID=1393 RepID=UPI0005A23E2C|nr:hypothetical protein [Brevibacillus brevis]